MIGFQLAHTLCHLSKSKTVCLTVLLTLALWQVRNVSIFRTVFQLHEYTPSDVVYFGDSRAEQLFEADARSSSVHPYSVRQSQLTRRICEDDDREKRELRVQRGFRSSQYRQISYFPCTKSEGECFENATGTRIHNFLRLRREVQTMIVFSLGTCEAIEGMDIDIFLLRLNRLIDVMERLKDVHTVWILPLRLFAPFTGEELNAKLVEWDSINSRVDKFKLSIKQTLITRKAQAFDIQDTIDECDVKEPICKMYTGRLSDDIFHLWDEVCDYAVHQLLWLSAPDTEVRRRELDHIFSDLVPQDVACGSQRAMSMEGPELHVAAFGGSVTSDGLLLNQVVAHLSNLLGRKISLHNFGEPATDSTYESFCIGNTLACEAVTPHIIIVEYCVNDMNPLSDNLRILLTKLLRLDPVPFLLYYCHRAPRNIFGGKTVDAHLRLAHDMGISSFTNKRVLNAMLNRSAEKTLVFRDDVHLTEFGAYLLGKLLAQAVTKCMTTTADQVLERLSQEFDDSEQCFTTLGSKEQRNFDGLSPKLGPGWNFVQIQHRSAPNGKNGYESSVAGSCLEIIMSVSCKTEVFLFYLLSGADDMGAAEVTSDACTNFSQIVDGRTSLSFSVTAHVRLEFAEHHGCCTERPTSTKVRICALPQQDNEKAVRFRTIAVGLRNME